MRFRRFVPDSVVGLLATGILATAACGGEPEKNTTAQDDQDLIGIDLGTPVYLPSGYESRSATEKRDVLQQLVIESEYDRLPSYGTLMSLELMTDFLRTTVNTSFFKGAWENDGDLMVNGRAKIIHRYASTATFTFQPTTPAAATGLLSAPAIGIVRIGPAIAPTSTAYVPGMGIKFFVDGQPSVNMVAMPSVDGQGRDRNTFALTYGTTIPTPMGLAQKVLEGLFAKAAGHGNTGRVGPGPLAAINRDGSDVDPSSITRIDEVLFEPTPESSRLIPSDSKQDNRTDLARRVPAGTKLFNVYIKPGRRYVGDIVTDSPFSSSRVGDRLFFKHDITPKPK